jgi:hypothetical protein
MMALSSPASDGTAEPTFVEARCRYRGDLAVAQCRCQVMLAMSLPRRLGHGTMLLPSHAVRSESGSMIGAMMCDRSRDVPTL